MKQQVLFDGAPSFTQRSTKAVTFQGKMTLPIHRWYRLTPSFSPQLANDIADHFSLSSTDFVLDPFSGVGTVPLCMKYRNIPACSVEINPYLQFVSNVKTRCFSGVDDVERTFSRFIDELRARLKSVPYRTCADAYLAAHAERIPAISQPGRWWSSGNLAQLICLRQLIAEFGAPPQHSDLLRMGVLGILIAVSNAKHNHVSLTFAKSPLATVEVADVLERQYQCMVQDMRAVQSMSSSEVVVYRGNSKCLSDVLPEGSDVSAVITSPPYPNRFSYARETRPHLFFFDFIENAAAVGELETVAIGGTWGKATSTLAKGVFPKNAVVESLLSPYLKRIETSGSLMASYVIKYFNDLFAHAEQVALVCRQHAQLAYVIGNSKFYGHPLPSDEILANIFAHFGFTLGRIDRMRRRQSKSGLYEAVVFMRR